MEIAARLSRAQSGPRHSASARTPSQKWRAGIVEALSVFGPLLFRQALMQQERSSSPGAIRIRPFLPDVAICCFDCTESPGCCSLRVCCRPTSGSERRCSSTACRRPRPEDPSCHTHLSNRVPLPNFFRPTCITLHHDKHSRVIPAEADSATPLIGIALSCFPLLNKDHVFRA